ncbi:MAG: DUF454 domain-containing protein [Bacteroidales bacterium]|nr:DUF454 domain-containing protein [Bacteroidales bacterium]
MDIGTQIFGKYIKHYRQHKSMPLKSKIIALTMMWVMIGLSAGVLLENLTIRIIVIVAGIIGSAVILSVKTTKNIKNESNIHELKH